MKKQILLGVLVLCAFLALLNLDRLSYYRALLTWRMQGIREYEMDETVNYPALAIVQMPSHFHVRDGAVISVDNPSVTRDQRPDAYETARTVDGLFASIEHFMNESEQHDGLIQVVSYDLVLGYPSSILITPQPQPGMTIYDGDQLTTVKNFKVLKAAAAP